jgi:hypothetical protein
VLLVIVLLFLGPKETLAGKFPGHAPEYLERYPPEPVPLPDPLPDGVEELCRLVEAGHATPEVLAALGEALLARGEGELAYRAFLKAQLRAADPPFARRMQERKDVCPRVSDEQLALEEREARYWVERLQEYERQRIGKGLDPRDLAPFHERYGRAEDDLRAVARKRRRHFALALGAGLLGAATILGGILFVRRRRT